MNEIEKTMKELKDKIVKDAMNQLDYIGVERQRVENLFYSVVYKSISLAQKEFLDFLDNWNWNEKCYMCRDHEDSYKELKASLQKESSK